MIDFVQEIILDLDKSKKSPNVPIVGRVGEKLNTILVIVKRDDSPVDVTGFSLRFRGLNPVKDFTDGMGEIENAQAGTFRYQFSENNLSCEGTFWLSYVELLDEHNQTLSTVNFTLKVLPEASLSGRQEACYASELERLRQEYATFIQAARAEWEQLKSEMSQ